MILYINTTNNDSMEISLEEDGGLPAIKRSIKTDYDQAEKLLPEVLKTLKSAKIDLKKIDKVRVADQGGSFTSLRIGIVTANALAFALGKEIEGEKGKTVKRGGLTVVEPFYGREPNISFKK